MQPEDAGRSCSLKCAEARHDCNRKTLGIIAARRRWAFLQPEVRCQPARITPSMTADATMYDLFAPTTRPTQDTQTSSGSSPSEALSHLNIPWHSPSLGTFAAPNCTCNRCLHLRRLPRLCLIRTAAPTLLCRAPHTARKQKSTQPQKARHTLGQTPQSLTHRQRHPQSLFGRDTRKQEQADAHKRADTSGAYAHKHTQPH